MVEKHSEFKIEDKANVFTKWLAHNHISIFELDMA